jgi:subtilisin family serine protease
MIVAGLALAAPAQGATPAVPQIRIDPTTLYFGAATPPGTVAAQAAEAMRSGPVAIPKGLREKAASTGSVRVIVRLATSFMPEGRLAALQAVEQRQTIRQKQDAALQKLQGKGAQVLARYQHIPFLALQVDAATLDALSRLPEVAGVEVDVFDKASLVSSNAVIGSGVAWSKGLTGAGQTIAILDTGVDKTHPYFSSGAHNKVVSEACYSSTTGSDYYGTTSLCPGGADEATGAGSGTNCASLAAGCQHGTHVAGIAAGNDGVGPAYGVARDADIIAIQVFSASCDGGCIGSWASDQIKAMERVYALADQYSIAAVNLSLGGSPYDTRSSCDQDNSARKAAIDNLRSLDIATVAAAGNSYAYGISAPACISSAISVSATDDDDQVPYWANISPELDLMAPGVAVESSVPGGGTAILSGTSMSSPHVAGAWAILRQQNPSSTVSDVRTTLRETGVQTGGFGFDLRRINLGKAVSAGPFVTREFTVHNDGGAVLSVLSLQLETLVSWVHWTPEAPFDIPPGGSRTVAVAVNFGAAPAGSSTNRLIVESTDGSKSPYPDAVHLVIDKEPCYPLTRTRTGSGGYPDANPSSSPGCAPGRYFAGQALQLTSHPGIGWGMQSWSGTDDDTSTAAANTLTMPAAAHTVAVIYKAQCFALTASHTGLGNDPGVTPASSAGCPAGTYIYAEKIQLAASPNHGWRIGGWTNTGNDASHKPTNSLSMPASAVNVSVSYLEGLPSVLFMYRLQGYSSSFLQALNDLGTVYDTWDLSTGTPDLSVLSTYPRVILDDAGFSNIDPAHESALSAYMDAGGGVLLNDPSYPDWKGVTPFLQSYFGVGTYVDYNYTSTLTGQGGAFGGMGPYNPRFGYVQSFEITPAAGAEIGFVDDLGRGVATNEFGPSFRSIFLGFPFDALPQGTVQRDVLGAALDYLGGIFADVPRGYWAKKWIEGLYRNGVTSGCSSNPRQYCPEGGMTRGQMASFLLLSKEGAGYAPPPCTTAPFNDVPVSNPLCPWIQELAHRGVTSGCGNGNYCPNSVVSRDQMAVFLLSTLQGPGYAPPACTTSSPFIDVSTSSPFCPWVAELARRGITGGCGGGSFCSSNPVNRAQMAVFLVTNFRLPLF